MFAITRPTFGDTPGSTANLPVEQHELGDGPRRGGALSHRHPDVGVLQRERVVHTVASHRDHGAPSTAAPRRSRASVAG